MSMSVDVNRVKETNVEKANRLAAQRQHTCLHSNIKTSGHDLDELYLLGTKLMSSFKITLKIQN